MATESLDADAMLAFVSELTKKFADLKNEMVGVGNQAGAGMKKATEETDKFGKNVDHHSRSMKEMKEETGGLVSLIRGPAGLAGGFYAAAQAMQNFVGGELRLRNFATDVGLSSEAVNKLRVQLSAAGIDAKTADQQIGALTSRLDNIKTYHTTSPVYRALAINDRAFADALVASEKAGDRWRSFQLAAEKWAREGPRTRLLIEKELGTSASTFEAYNKNQKGLHELWVYPKDKLDEFEKNFTNLTVDIKNVWGAAMMSLVNASADMLKKNEEDAKAVRELWNSLKKDFEGKGEKGSEIFGKKGFLPSQEELGGAWEWLKKNMSMEAAASTPTGKETLLEGDKDELSIQKDSNKVLQDIRDLMSGEKQGTGGGITPGTGATPGTPGAQSGSSTSTGATATPSTSAAGPGVPNYGATPPMGQTAATGIGDVSGKTSVAELEKNKSAQEAIQRFQKAFPNVPDAKAQIYDLVKGESGMGRNMLQSNQYAGYFALGKDEAYGQMGLSKQQFAALPFDKQMDAYTKWAQKNDPTGQRVKNLGLFNAASALKWQGMPDDTVIYPAGSKEARANASTWGRASGAGGAVTVGGVKKYYGREDPKTQTEIAAAQAQMASEKDASRKSLDKSLVASRDLGGAKVKVDFSGSEKDKDTTKALDEGAFKKLHLSRPAQAAHSNSTAATFNERFVFE